jgi:hypothetical protein
VKQDTILAPLFKTLRTDVTNMQAQLAADRLAESNAVLADENVVVAEMNKIAADHGNATALKADHTALVSDRIKLQDDEIAGLNSRLATRQADYTTISADIGAIAAAVQNDAGASAQVKADVAKFTTDRTNALNAFEGDLQKLIADRGKLVTDLTALQQS